MLKHSLVALTTVAFVAGAAALPAYPGEHNVPDPFVQLTAEAKAPSPQNSAPAQPSGVEDADADPAVVAATETPATPQPPAAKEESSEPAHHSSPIWAYFFAWPLALLVRNYPDGDYER